MFDLGQLNRVANFLGWGSRPPKVDGAVRIGLIGASQVSTYAVVWPAQKLATCKVVAVAARDGSRANDFAKFHGIPKAYGSYEELLADPEIDAVYIGLPNGLHGAWSSRALQAGKHVLCEKPFTANYEEAKQVQDLARRSKRLCREAFHYREHPLMTRLQQLVAPGGPLGQVSRIDAKLLIPNWVFGSGNIRFMEDLAGGAMMDAGTYCAHASRTLAAASGAPSGITVTSAAAKLRPGSKLVDGAMVVNWSSSPSEASSPPAAAQSGWASLLRAWSRPVAAGGTGPEVRGRFLASLQHDGPVPVTEINIKGSRGSLTCQGFVVPFFGHMIQVKTSEEGGQGGQAPRTRQWTERAYGSGQTTYYYQLERFVTDLQALDGAKQKGSSSSSSSSALARATSALREDEADALANMRFIDQAYTASGLPVRFPTGSSVKIQAPAGSTPVPLGSTSVRFPTGSTAKIQAPAGSTSVRA
mmetsp:Transcript_18598/g.39942  ORF Transcript_18598/g.39942 Transcript_18598/m.39942 type:complete len:472 (-) Transcript_18598:1154-2569(-)